MKRVVAGALALSMVLGGLALPQAAAEITAAASASSEKLVSGKYTYIILDDGTVEISHYKGEDEELKIPRTIDGRKVTRLGKQSFSGYAVFKRVIIPDTVKYIGNEAFELCQNLEYVEIPEGVEEIAPWAFAGCYKLPEVKIPSTVKTIGDAAFFECVLFTEITIPEGVEKISDITFNGCGRLEKITIPKSVTSIGNSAFLYCKNVTDIYYGGTEEDWAKVFVDSYNQCFEDAVIHCRPVVTKPEKVTLASYSSATDAVRINWEKSEGAGGYRVYRYNDSTKKWDTVKTISGGDTLTYRDGGLASAKVYKYKVKAYKKENGTTIWGDASAEYSTATKPAKAVISKISVSTTAARVIWNEVKGATGYKLQQSADGKTWTTVKVVKNATEYKITGLKKNTTYKYRVCAYKSDGTKNVLGAYSAVVSAATKK